MCACVYVCVYICICGKFISEQFDCNGKEVCSNFGYSILLKKKKEGENKDGSRGKIPPAVNPETAQNSKFKGSIFRLSWECSGTFPSGGVLH